MKYELSRLRMTYRGRTLYRIRALKDFHSRNGPVICGALGGLVESLANLSQDGTCWVHDDAKAYGKAIVENDAVLCEYAEAYDCARVSERAAILQNASVYENARVWGRGRMTGSARAFGDASVGDDAYLRGGMIVSRSALVRQPLRAIKGDLWMVLTKHRSAAHILWEALHKGWIDGRLSEGPCSCLSGTLDRAKRISAAELDSDCAELAEDWFAGIYEGDTLSNNLMAQQAAVWIAEWAFFSKVKLAKFD